MSWAIAFDARLGRDVGYGVPAVCDHPVCTVEIDRGLSYICGSDPYGGEYGCGLAFCSEHLIWATRDGERVWLCERCMADAHPFDPKPDVAEWVRHKLTDESWGEWRAAHPDDVAEMVRALAAIDSNAHRTLDTP